MFNAVAKAHIHHQQALNLIKLRKKIQNSMLFEAVRLKTIEHNLASHIYAITGAELEKINPEIEHLVWCMDELSQRADKAPLQLSELIVLESENPEKVESLSVIFGLLPIAEQERYFSTNKLVTDQLEMLLMKHNKLYELVMFSKVNWPSDMLHVARQTALAGQLTPSLQVACLLFGQSEVSPKELSEGYIHTQFEIAKACFIKGLEIDKTNAQNALFNRFANTDSANQKAELLEIAGLSGDIRWQEPCSLFCQENPDWTFTVLSHFQDKHNLTLHIELMGVAQTSQLAYQAWLLLTDARLEQVAQIQDTTNRHNNAGSNAQPNTDHAELIRQTLMQQTGRKILFGREFDGENALDVLNGLQGKAVQRALLLNLPMDNGMPLYCSELTNIQFSYLISLQKKQVKVHSESENAA